MDPFEQDMIDIGDTDHCAAICKKCRNKGSRLCCACQGYEYLEDEVFPGTPQAEAIRQRNRQRRSRDGA